MWVLCSESLKVLKTFKGKAERVEAHLVATDMANDEKGQDERSQNG